jgi:multidrug efflux pump
MRAITISASLNDNYSLGSAIADMENIIRTKLPEAAQINYNGESRDLKQTGSALYLTFLLALVIGYLVLAAQFESFKHPLIIMTTVPLAISGALLGLTVFNSTINIFSQIGAIMLIGLAAKNGILIVEFANQLRDRGYEFIEAIIESSTTRLRPVLMTSLCTAFGSIPLLLASGAGELSRQSIGAVVFFGVTFAMVLTLVVVPTVYVVVARNSHSPEYVGQMIDKLRLSTSKKTTPQAQPGEVS